MARTAEFGRNDPNRGLQGILCLTGEVRVFGRELCIATARQLTAHKFNEIRYHS
jgi:hypothetical protein